MPCIELGLTPVPIDVSLETLNISSTLLEKTIDKTPIKLLFLTHLLGFCDDVERIRDICNTRHILLIEDTCESLGSVYKGVKLGNFGLASTYSFYVGHHLSTIEGGAIVTDDEELGIMLRLVRAHGWDRNLSFVQQKEIHKKFKINSQFYSR
jgi:CDP-6-deoxy-D-xylo-4-hexulose-3-dehydrase